MTEFRKRKTPDATPAEVAHWRSLKNAGWSFGQIARAVGRSKETIRYQLYPERIYRAIEARQARKAEAAINA